LLVGAIQFINILDFVIPLPMGPDLAKGLGIPTSQIGLIGAAYVVAAALSGLAGSFFLDRFDRRKAVAVAMMGLVLGTAAGGLAISALPPMRGHLRSEGPVPHHHAWREIVEIIRTPTVQLSYLTTAVVMVGGFILIPNISAYVQGNLGYPRSQLQYLYFYGGI